MLARGVVTRPAVTIRRGSQLQKRFVHPSIFQLQAPRPNTWLAKIRFRADGKPRSKLIALGFSSLILVNSLSFLTLSNTFKNGLFNHGLLEDMISVQKADIDYDSVNFDDFISTLSHFKKLYRPSTSLSEEEIDKYFNELMAKISRTQGPEKSAEVQLKAHHILRLAAEKIHGAFRELNRDSVATTAEFIKLALREAWTNLVELLGDDDNSSRKRALQLDAEFSKDYYEVLG